MKKNQVNKILTNQAKRRNVVLSLICVIIIISIVTLSCFLIYGKRSEKQYVSYDETSNIDYKVFLKENNFFEENYLGANNQYIASLINYIKANFNYKLQLEEKKDIEYKYSYRIEADVVVKEKETDNPLYRTNKVLVNKKEKTTTLDNIVINEDIDIDYNYYNNLIKNFIDIYGLDDTESVLTLNMYVNVGGSCEDLKDNKEESVMSLSIPLTTKTMAIDISNNLINSEDNIMQCSKSGSYNFIFIILGIIFGIIDLRLITFTVKYEFKTRTAENIYEKELKKILNNYSSYIQTLGSDFEFKDYQVLKVNTFTDMLEIRDTIRQPILMKENSEKTSAYFVIPSNTKILYVYRLKATIKKEAQKTEKEDKEIL